MTSLVVPVRRSSINTLTPMTARLADGTCVGVAFTSLTTFEAVQPGRDSIRMGEDALHAMLAPLGIDTIKVDPHLIVADLCSTAPERPICA